MNIDINNPFNADEESNDNSPEEIQEKTASETGGGIVELAYDISPERHNEIDAEIDVIWEQDIRVSDTIIRATKEIAKTDAEKQVVGYLIGRRVGIIAVHTSIKRDPMTILRLLSM